MRTSTIVSTLATLASRGCDIRAVYLGDGNPEDRYAILRTSSVTWEVYYLERGEKLERQEFDAEGNACAYLVELLDSDATVWRKVQ